MKYTLSYLLFKIVDYVDYADRACCRALTADCLACTEGVTIEEFCIDNPDVEGCPSKKEYQFIHWLRSNDYKGPLIINLICSFSFPNSRFL